MQMGCGERVKIAWKMCVRFYKIRSGGKECPCRDLTLQLNIRLRNFSISCLLPEQENGTRVVRSETLSNTLSMLMGNRSLSKKKTNHVTLWSEYSLRTYLCRAGNSSLPKTKNIYVG
jgi:hypothetical protein